MELLALYTYRYQPYNPTTVNSIVSQGLTLI